MDLCLQRHPKPFEKIEKIEKIKKYSQLRLAGWLPGCLAGWLAAWLDGWLAGRVKAASLEP